VPVGFPHIFAVYWPGLLLSALVAALVAAPALAEEGDQDVPAEAPLVLDPVEVKAPQGQDAHEPTAQMRVVALDSPGRFGSDLGGVLAAIPGLVVRSAGGLLQPQTLYLRGAGPEQVVVSLAGVRLNGLAHGRFDLSLVPLEAVAAAEVLSGAGAIGQGSGAQGGVVRLGLLEASPAPGLHSVVQAGGGRFGSYRGHLGLGWAGEAGQLRVGLSAAESRGDFTYVDPQGSEERRANNDAGQVSAFAAGRWRTPWEWQVEGTSFFSRVARGVPGPSEFPARFAAARSEEWQWLNGVEALTPLWRWGAVEVLGALRFGHRMASFSYENPTALLGGAAFASENQEQHLVPETVWSASWGGWNGTLLGGFSYGHLTRGAERFDRWTWHGAAALEWSPWEMDLLLLSSAVRLEGAGRAAPEVLPRVGLRLEPLSGLVFFGNVGWSFRHPSFDELYLRTEFVRGQKGLRNEQTFQVDAGLAAQPWAWLTLRSSVFKAAYTDAILFVPVTAHYYQAQNLRGADAHGVESQLVLAWPFGLVVDLSHTWSEARFSAAPQSPLPGRPTQVVGALVRYSLDWLRVELSGRYTGARHLDTYGLKVAEAYLSLDAGAELRWAPRWSVALKCNNLLDERQAVDALQQPLPGFSFFLSLRWYEQWL